MTTARSARLFAGPALTLILAGCGGPAGDARLPAQPAPVATQAARLADVPVALTAVGTVESPATVAIKTMINGELIRQHFREGQEVRRGDVLFSIDPRFYEAAVRQAEGALARDKAQLANARDDEKRYAELVAKDFVTQEQYRAALTAVEALEATVKVDEGALDAARVNLSYCTIRSPIDGRMGEALVQAGNVVKANDATLATIKQLRPIDVSFTIPDQRLADVRRRQAEGRRQVEVAPPEGGEPRTGELEFIDNTINPATGAIQLKARFPNADGALWPGQFVNVRLVLETRTGVTVAPSAALQSSQQGTFVFVVKPDQTVEMRLVATGPEINSDTVIEKGLSPGEVVVTEGQLRLVPGSRVEVKNSAGGPA